MSIAGFAPTHPLPGAGVNIGRTSVRDASAIPCRGALEVRAVRGIGTLRRHQVFYGLAICLFRKNIFRGSPLGGGLGSDRWDLLHLAHIKILCHLCSCPRYLDNTSSDAPMQLKTACRCAQFCILRMSTCVASFMLLSTMVSPLLKVCLSLYTGRAARQRRAPLRCWMRGRGCWRSCPGTSGNYVKRIPPNAAIHEQMAS